MTTAQIIFLSAAALVMLALFIYTQLQKQFSINSIKRKTVGDGQYGTARFATDAEIHAELIRVPYTPELWRKGQNLPTVPGVVLSLEKRLGKLYALVDPKDNHTLMVAAPGGGKTTCFMLPNIEYQLACGLSVISTDSKGDILRFYKTIAEKYYGYKTCNINFRSPSRSDSFNYMQLVNLYIDTWKHSGRAADKSRAERYAKITSRSIVRASGFDGGGQNAFFYDAAEGLITSVILLVAEYCQPPERHIVTVFKLILELMGEAMQPAPKGERQKTRLHELLELLPPDDKARWFAGTVSQITGQSFASVMSTAMSRLLAFIDSETEGILCHDSNVTIQDVCEQRVMLFITFPEEDETKHVLVSLLLTQIANEAVAYADEHTAENRLARRLYIFADEFGIFPRVSNIVGLFGSIRSRNILLVPCIQTPHQLRMTYGQDGEAIILSCCQSIIFGGFSPLSDTASTFSKILDNQTISGGSVSSSSGHNGLDRSTSSRNVSMISRPLMTPDELQRLPFGSWIVKRRGCHPFLAHMPRYSAWGIQLDDPFLSDEQHRPTAVYGSITELERAIRAAHPPAIHPPHARVSEPNYADYQ